MNNFPRPATQPSPVRKLHIKTRIVLSLFLILLSSALFSQKDFRPGYIITLEGDTLRGEISYRNDMKNSLNCIYKDSSGKRIYEPFDIQSYRFLDGKYYVSQYVYSREDTSLLFLEYLVKGKKDLLYYREPSGFHYILGLSDTSAIEIPFREAKFYRDENKYKKNSTIHIGYLKTYLKDCPELYPVIENISKPKEGNLIRLMKQYHETCSRGLSSIDYIRNNYDFRFTFEPMLGAGYAPKWSTSFSYIGANVYFWLPALNENLHLKTGASYLTENGRKADLIQIPFQLHYLFPGKIIRPRIDGGFNFITDFSPLSPPYFSVGSGALVRISSTISLNLGIHYNFAFYPDPFIKIGSIIIVETGLYFNFPFHW